MKDKLHYYKDKLSKLQTRAGLALILLALVTACGTKAATVNTAQGEINIPFDQPYGLILGPDSSFSLPQEGKGNATFTVGEQDNVTLSGNFTFSPEDNNFEVIDEEQKCSVGISGQDGITDTPLVFEIQCSPQQNSTEQETPTP